MFSAPELSQSTFLRLLPLQDPVLTPSLLSPPYKKRENMPGRSYTTTHNHSHLKSENPSGGLDVFGRDSFQRTTTKVRLNINEIATNNQRKKKPEHNHLKSPPLTLGCDWLGWPGAVGGRRGGQSYYRSAPALNNKVPACHDSAVPFQ